MKLLKNFIAAALVGVLALCAVGAEAQTAGTLNAVNPLTRDLGKLITLTSQGAATVNSVTQSGFNVSRVWCVMNVSAQTGTPSSTFSIQNYDPSSGQYVTLITSTAVTAINTPNAIAAGAGVFTTANVGAGVPIARNWRVTVTVGGTSPVVTGTIACSAQ